MFKNKFFVIGFTIFASITSIFIKFTNKELFEIYPKELVILINLLLSLCILSIFIIYSGKMNDILAALSKITPYDSLRIVGVSSLMFLLFYTTLTLIQHHDISYLTLIDTAFDVLMAVLIAYLFYNENLNIKKIIGIVAILGGVFLIH
jgi:uncharacterized membrane protein